VVRPSASGTRKIADPVERRAAARAGRLVVESGNQRDALPGRVSRTLMWIMGAALYPKMPAIWASPAGMAERRALDWMKLEITGSPMSLKLEWTAIWGATIVMAVSRTLVHRIQGVLAMEQLAALRWLGAM